MIAVYEDVVNALYTAVLFVVKGVGCVLIPAYHLSFFGGYELRYVLFVSIQYDTHLVLPNTLSIKHGVVH